MCNIVDIAVMSTQLFTLMKSDAIGCAVKSRRLELGIDQKALSEISGVAVHTLSNMEAGRGNPTVRTLARVLDAIGMDLRIVIKDEQGT